MIVVPGNPLENLQVLEDVLVVMSIGQLALKRIPFAVTDAAETTLVAAGRRVAVTWSALVPLLVLYYVHVECDGNPFAFALVRMNPVFQPAWPQ